MAYACLVLCNYVFGILAPDFAGGPWPKTVAGLLLLTC
jgi:hypothetical protein